MFLDSGHWQTPYHFLIHKVKNPAGFLAWLSARPARISSLPVGNGTLVFCHPLCGSALGSAFLMAFLPWMGEWSNNLDLFSQAF